MIHKTIISVSLREFLFCGPLSERADSIVFYLNGLWLSCTNAIHRLQLSNQARFHVQIANTLGYESKYR